VALPHGFKQDDRGRLRHIQGIDLPSHRDADGGRTAPRGAQASVLCPQDQGAGEAQIHCGIEPTGGRSRGQKLHRVLAQPVLRLHRGGNSNRDGTEGALTGADDVRIPDICLALTDDEPGHASSISGAQDRSQIPGFLESLSDEIEGHSRTREMCQAYTGLGGYAQDAVGVIAIANFVEHGRGDRLQRDASGTGLV